MYSGNNKYGDQNWIMLVQQGYLATRTVVVVTHRADGDAGLGDWVKQTGKKNKKRSSSSRIKA